MKNDVPKRSPLAFLCCCCFPKPTSVVTVHLDSAQGLEKQDIMGAGILFSDTTETILSFAIMTVFQVLIHTVL